MSLTRQRSITRQQAANAGFISCCTLVSSSVINWSPVFICPDSVGSRSGQYGKPGFGDLYAQENSKLNDRTPAQIHIRMKNSRKETGLPASDKLRAYVPTPANCPADQVMIDSPVFTATSTPRSPESPAVESLRSMLKANLPSEKASPALLPRIRSRMHDHKE